MKNKEIKYLLEERNVLQKALEMIAKKRISMDLYIKFFSRINDIDAQLITKEVK
jgi:hypothetical protein